LAWELRSLGARQIDDPPRFVDYALERRALQYFSRVLDLAGISKRFRHGLSARGGTASAKWLGRLSQACWMLERCLRWLFMARTCWSWSATGPGNSGRFQMPFAEFRRHIARGKGLRSLSGAGTACAHGLRTCEGSSPSTPSSPRVTSNSASRFSPSARCFSHRTSHVDRNHRQSGTDLIWRCSAGLADSRVLYLLFLRRLLLGPPVQRRRRWR
jgi:hypothetical protein